ncbi:MAG: metallophosphoesterase [Pseudomonadota bacterium]|nr:metallophosphoesterase [Pseudomonadota bacterium]
MRIWFILLILVIFSTVSGLVYLTSRVAKFGFMLKLTGENTKLLYLYGLVLVLAVFGMLCLWLNMMNAVIVVLHLMVLWLVCDAIFGFIEYRQQPFQHYYAGICAVAMTVLALGTGWFLNHHVWTTYYTIETDKTDKPLRIIHFADSHIGTTFDGDGFAEHVAEMQKLNPDVVVIVGDFVDDDTSLEDMKKACAALGSLKTTYGVYFAFGNHDKGYYSPEKRGYSGSELVAELQKNGVTVLQDEAVLLDDNYYILGRKDQSEFYRGGKRKNMDALVKPLDKSKFVVVLDHQPNDYKNQAEAEVDLVLSGHTHGGQLWPLSKAGEWMGVNDRTYGRERRHLTDFIVTSGISDWAIKFKTGTKSEIVVIDIKNRS